MEARILIIEDDEALAATFCRILAGAGYKTAAAADYAGGKELLAPGSYDAMFLDINLRGKQTGIDLLKDIRVIDRDIPVVIITGFPEVATAAEAVRNAAFDYLCKPIEKEQLLRVAAAAVRRRTENDEEKRRRENLEAVVRNVRDTLVAVELNTAPDQAIKTPSQTEARHNLLSEREHQIITLLGQGEATADIAAAFCISARTVETYCARIISKLDLGGMKELRRYAIQYKS